MKSCLLLNTEIWGSAREEEWAPGGHGADATAYDAYDVLILFIRWSTLIIHEACEKPFYTNVNMCAQ